MFFPTTWLSIVNLSLSNDVLWLDESLFACSWSRMGDDLWGIDTILPPTQNADGLGWGLNEWFLWQQLHNLNVWEGEETWRRRPQQQGLLCNKQLCMCPWVHLSELWGLLLNINVFFRIYWSRKLWDICSWHADIFKDTEWEWNRSCEPNTN